MDKLPLRDRYIELRSDLSVDAAKRLAERIAERFKSDVDISGISRIHAYTSVAQWNEVDTSWLKDFIGSYHPDVSLDFSSPDRSSPLPAPVYDMIIVPLLAFDDDLQRLGFGGGWYDRFLAGQPDALKIGFAYEFQHADQIPVEPHDIPLDLIITQKRVIRK